MVLVRPCESTQVVAGGFVKVVPSVFLSQKYSGSCVTATEGDQPGKTLGKLGGKAVVGTVEEVTGGTVTGEVTGGIVVGGMLEVGGLVAGTVTGTVVATVTGTVTLVVAGADP